MKPVAAGCEPGDGGWRNADALALQAASRPRPPYADVNPYPLPEPTAPQLAARAAGVRVSPGVLAAAHARIAANCDVVVVEGAGGWLSPLADGIEHALLARSLDADVVLVVGVRLGCLSHARLSARAIEDGLRLAGWIGSTLEPDFSADYLALVETPCRRPASAILPYLPGATRVPPRRRCGCRPGLAGSRGSLSRAVARAVRRRRHRRARIRLAVVAVVARPGTGRTPAARTG